MADQPSGSTRKSGGHEASLGRQALISDRVHASVHGVELAIHDEPVDRARAEAEGDQLSVSYHSVLLFRERREPSTTLVTLMPYSGINVTHVGHGATLSHSSERFRTRG
jgi:hypothetical protein